MGRPVIRTALDLPILDLGSFYTSPDCEGALQELGGGGGGGGAAFAEVAVTPFGGQTVFVLPVAILGIGAYSAFVVNGVEYAKTTDYTIVGTTATWLDTPFTLEATDRVLIKYQTS